VQEVLELPPRAEEAESVRRVEVPLPTPDELRHMIVEELPFWAKIIRDNNIKAGT
jgi:hypothetical protein